jgi:hypothetical protein
MLSGLHKVRVTEFVAVVLVVVPEAFFLLVSLAENCVRVLLQLLVMLKLSLKRIIVEGVLRGHLFRVRGDRSVRGIRLDKLPNFLLKLGFFLVACCTLARLADLAGSVAAWKALTRRRSIVIFVDDWLYPILLEDREPKHLILEIVLFILVVVVDPRVRRSFFLTSQKLAWVLRFVHQLPILHPEHFILFFEIHHLLLHKDS